KINLILILGALLISLSGFIFAVATWGALNTFFKSVVLISFSALFFAIHSVSERKLKLPQTGRVFYILGSIFLPSAVVAAGILKVFGEYFSFTGDGRAAVIAVIFLTVCIPLFKGAQDYKNRFWAAVSFYTFSAAVMSLIWQVSPNGSVVALAASVFALATAILEPTAQKQLERLFGEDNVFSAEFSRFSAVNAWALSIVSLFAAESGFVSLAAFAVFSACFLTKTVTDKGSTAGAIAFAFFITTSMFIGFDPGDFSEIICIIAATALICGVLSVMGIFPEALKKALNILGIAAAGITGFCAFLENAIQFSKLETPSPVLVIALAAVFAELLIFALRYKTAYYKAMSFGALLLLSSAASQLILGGTQFAVYTFAASYAVVLAYFCITRFTKLRDRLYVPINDIILAVYAFWCPIILTLADMYTLQSSVISIAITALTIVSLILSNNEKIAPIICPLLTFLSFFHIYGSFEIFCIIAVTALICCGVLLVMDTFPEALKKVLNVLGTVAAGIAGFCVLLKSTILFSSLEAPLPVIVIALAAVFAELLIFTLRYKTSYYKAMSFGATLLLSSAVLQLIFGDAYLGIYTPFFSYVIVLAYFCAARFTRLKEKLYTSANDIISAAYALWCAMILPLHNMYTVQNYVLSLVILALGAACAAVSNHKKFSPVICPILTFAAVFPLSDIFDKYNFYPFADEVAVSALAVITILICAIGTLLLFIKRAENYAKAYGIAVVASLPIFTIACIAESNSDFIPVAAITVYTAVYLFKIAFPKEKYVQIMLLHGMILLTMIFVGVRYADPGYAVMCFPSVAAVMIFAVNIIGTAFGSFEKTSKHTEHFLWYAMPALSGILLWISNEEELVPMLIFGIILAVCALLLSIFRRNTMPLIFPVFVGLLIVSEGSDPIPKLIFAVILAALGHVLFRKKLWEKYYFDIFSIAAFLSEFIAFVQSDGDNQKWLSILIFALLTANLMRSGQSSKANRTILTAAAAFLFPLWWTVPFFTVPDLIAVQFNLLPVVIFCVILRFIWHDALPAVYNFAFISAIVSLIVLFIDAMASGNNFDSIFIGVVLFIMLAVSFIIKKKRWFVLAVASMVVSAVLLSISHFDSIAWLIYLLIAGAALIALGVINELKKQQKKSGEDTKLTRFMSDWTW
ncbi:MAG: hypothetical protein K2J11_11720, partial [Oscillospiraceae bacterium]|nr:hypothetical protein [Oscillospiraceae bacterium]